MIVIPTGTDAPIYHWPYATVGLMILNAALLFLVPPHLSEPEVDDEGNVVEARAEVPTFERYALALGDGTVHPVQWVTHNFLHYGFMHLLGNLIFLWSFGIVIEGKLGALKYLVAYLAIGTLHGALVQTLLMKSGLDAHAAGASAVVYGLLAMCMVWAPRNELNCLFIFWIGFRIWVREFDLYFTTVALWYIGEQLFGLAFWGGAAGRIMVSEMGHLSGAFWGALVAFALLKANLVDCEGWDIFSVWKRYKELGRQWKERGARQEREQKQLRETVKARAREDRARAKASRNVDDDGPDAAALSATAVKKVQKLIDQGDIPAALHAYDKAARTQVNWPPRQDLYTMIKSLHARGAEADSLPLMRDHCRYYPADSAKVRLKLAQVLLRDRQRPVAALRVLGEIPAGSLPPDLESARLKLVRHADKLREEGVLELEEDD
jgi:membrane associated rhomboid family serine protease